MIEVQNLSRNYGDFKAVKEASFSIGKGEIVGLLGHNGAGKTTILKMITGYLEPSTGTITIDGLNIHDFRLEVQEKIGYLPENCPLYPEMTVISYLDYVASLRGLDEAGRQKAVREVIEKIKLNEKANSPINTLSRGFQQRVGVAQAMLHHPKILILDEPTNGLDPAQILEMRNLIKDLSADATVVLSTHILQEVQAICDRAIIIRRGEVALDAHIAEMQSSNRLLVTVDRSPDDALETLKAIDGVSEVEALSTKDSQYQYALKLAEDRPAVAPAVARAIFEKGFQLHALYPEMRDLETVFREINAGGLNE